MNVQPVPARVRHLAQRHPCTLTELRGRPVALLFVNAASAWARNAWPSSANGCRAIRASCAAGAACRRDFERDASAALKLLRRQGLTMPVLLDADWDGWRRFGVSAWPTLVLLDAQGRSSNG